MLKHIRDALKLAGVSPSDISPARSQNGHIIFWYNGRKITCSGSPKDPHTATLRIAKELK